jgi:hypothetical protein
LATNARKTTSPESFTAGLVKGGPARIPATSDPPELGDAEPAAMYVAGSLGGA